MNTAAKDQNAVSSLIAVLNGVTILPIKAHPTKHTLQVNDWTEGTDYGPRDALHDFNDIPTVLAVSRYDNKTPVVVYCDSSGNLMVDSN